MLVYGESGHGKSTFASTFDGPILWLVCSGSGKPGELRSIDTPENREKITPRVITMTEHFKQHTADAHNFACTVLDHASGLADVVLKDILGYEELPAQKSWGIASQQQYGQQAFQLKEMFRYLLNLPNNVVVLAQQRTFNGADDGPQDVLRPTVGAALSPSVVGWLNPAVDFVVQMFKRPKMVATPRTVGGKTIMTEARGEGVEFCMRCEHHDVFTTKFRVPASIAHKVPKVIVNPTYAKVQAVIRGEAVDDSPSVVAG